MFVAIGPVGPSVTVTVTVAGELPWDPLPWDPLPGELDSLPGDELNTGVRPETSAGAPNPGVFVVRQLQASEKVAAKFIDSKHGEANSGYGKTDGVQDSTHVQASWEGAELLDWLDW